MVVSIGTRSLNKSGTRTEDQVQRRLAAILAADVVGYSRLMDSDEELTLRTLRAQRQVIDELVTS